MKLSQYFDIRISHQDKLDILKDLNKNIYFKGFNLWVLVFAIFIASLGLNVNSTAVIIGAMLISPMMGPIIGMGFSIAIPDIDMFKRAFKHYSIAVIVSIITATLYFLLSPINDAQSELLARTNPNIYDVLIAFFGGFAGVVAICAKEKGNVIPGVAIATALMPPLCTAGFGIAHGEWTYFFGALYLFFINTIFICFSTILGLYIFNFSSPQLIEDIQKEYNRILTGIDARKRIIKYIAAIIIITIIPSIYTTYNVINESIFTNNANKFISNELTINNVRVIQKQINVKERSIHVILYGDMLDSITVNNARNKLNNYHLFNTQLLITQNEVPDNINIDEIKTELLSELYNKQDIKLKEKDNKIIDLEGKIALYTYDDSIVKNIVKNVNILFPDIEALSINKTFLHYTNNNIDTTYIANIKIVKPLNESTRTRFNEWLKINLNTNKLHIIEFK